MTKRHPHRTTSDERVRELFRECYEVGEYEVDEDDLVKKLLSVDGLTHLGLTDAEAREVLARNREEDIEVRRLREERARAIAAARAEIDAKFQEQYGI